MVISTLQSEQTFLGNGVTTVFSFSFVYDSSTVIEVSYTDADGIITVLSPSVYTLNLTAPAVGAIWGAGGTVTYPISGAPIAIGTSLTVSRVLPFTQTISIANQGNFAPEVIEEMGDTLQMQIQQLAARTGKIRGVWATDTVYNYSDIVMDGANGTNTGNYYQCALGNTSDTWTDDLAAGDWVLAIAAAIPEAQLPLSVPGGGTGITSYSQGDLIYASDTFILSPLTKNANATRYLSNTGTNNNPAWSQINLANGISGNLAVIHLNSGTGATSATFWRGDGTWAAPASAAFVAGPSSATDSALALFDGTTGKLIKDSALPLAVSTVTRSTDANVKQYSFTLPVNGMISWTQNSTLGHPFSNTVQVSRAANYNGGTVGWVNAAVYAQTTVGANAASFEWAVLGVVNNSATGGENVGVYGEGNAITPTTGPTWGMVANATDQSGTDRTAGATIGIEIDCFANGVNTGRNRIGANIVAGTYGAGAAAEIWAGLYFTNYASAYYNNVIYIGNDRTFAEPSYNVTTGIRVDNIVGTTLLWDSASWTNGILLQGTYSGPAAVINTTTGNHLPTAPAGTLLQIAQADAVANRVLFNAFNSSSNLIFERADGTAATPSAVQSGETLGNVAASGYGATAYSATNRATIKFVTSENWTDAAQGAHIEIAATAVGGIITATIADFTSTGLNSCAIGATTPSTGAFTTLTATTFNGNTFTAGSGVLTLGVGKTATISNTLTFTGTDSSSVAFGTGGAVLYSGGALGAPSSGTLTNCTGLPVSTGISGLGSGIATWLTTPSSANLISAITDETGTGSLVFANTPTLVTPNIGAATGTSVALTAASSINSTTGNHPPSALSGTLLQMSQANSTNARLQIDGFAASGNISFTRADTSSAAPSALQSDDSIGVIGAFGYGSSQYSTNNISAIKLIAAENFSNTSNATYISFLNTPSGSVTALEVARFTDSALVFTSAANGIVLKRGANGKVGTVTLTGTTAVSVSNTSIATSDIIYFSLNTVGGAVGAFPTIKTLTAASGFTVAGSAGDTSIYNYAITSSKV